MTAELIKLRNIKNLTQKQVAERAYVTIRAYQNYEYGKRKPVVDIALNIAEVLGIVTLEDFRKLFLTKKGAI